MCESDNVNELEFTINGQTYRLTRQQVVARAQGLAPLPIQRWAVEVDGRRFPVKQVLAEATGTHRMDFISHRACDILRRLGFPVIDVDQESAGDDGAAVHDELEVSQSGRGSMRVAALNAAVAYSVGRPEVDPRAVLQTAAQFERWLGGPHTNLPEE